MRGARCAKNNALQHTCQESFPLRNQYDDRQAMISLIDQAVILAAGAPIRGRSGQTRTAIDDGRQTPQAPLHLLLGFLGFVLDGLAAALDISAGTLDRVATTDRKHGRQCREP